MPKSYLIAALLIFCEFCVGSLIIPTRLMEWSGQKETAWMVDFYGQENAALIRSHARSWFDRLFVASGLVASSYRFFVPTEEDIRQADPKLVATLDRTGLTGFAEDRLRVFWSEIYQMVERMSHIALWFAILAPFWIWYMLDGLLSRSMRQHTFGYQSPLLHTYSLILSGLIWTGLVAMTVLPVPIPMEVYPVCAILQGILIGVVAANIQKRI